MSNDDYQIKITKPSKYPRTKGWCEGEGVLTTEEIEYIINMDRIDTRLEEGIELTDEDRQYLIFSDAQIEFIEANQKKLDIEFTEEEKKLSFI